MFYYSPKVAYPERLYGIKITRIQEIENLALGHLKIFLKKIVWLDWG
jgi:hypothetical protein